MHYVYTDKEYHDSVHDLHFHWIILIFAIDLQKELGL